jgi:hypothetical protein
LIAAAAWLVWPVQVLRIVHVETRRLAWRVPVHNGTLIDLEYTNSLFLAPTTERFVVLNGLLRLTEISSTSQAVLEYLALEPPYERRGDRVVAKRPGLFFEELPIRIGQTGQQRLVVDGRQIPLYQVGTGEAVRVRIDNAPRLIQLVRARRGR